MVESARSNASGRTSRAAAAERLEIARGVLRRVEGRTGGRPSAAPSSADTRDAAIPGPAEDGRVLPVPAALARVLPGGGPRLGSTLAVTASATAGGSGATSLLFALAGEVTGRGGWVGVVGRPDLGLVAAAEAGVRLERLALVPHPGTDLAAITIALLDGMDLVAVAGAARAGFRAGDRQRLAARARARGTVLLSLEEWPGADLELRCTGPRWTGLDRGAGRLTGRSVHVGVRGRGVVPGRGEEFSLPLGAEVITPPAPFVHPEERRVAAVAG